MEDKKNKNNTDELNDTFKKFIEQYNDSLELIMDEIELYNEDFYDKDLIESILWGNEEDYIKENYGYLFEGDDE